jgi:hypothetical protein
MPSLDISALEDSVKKALLSDLTDRLLSERMCIPWRLPIKSSEQTIKFETYISGAERRASRGATIADALREIRK